MLAGLILVMMMMYSLRKCSYTPGGLMLIPSGGDTVDVAIEYAPLSLYRYDDTLGGFDYDMLRELASRHNLILKFHPVVSMPQSLEMITSDVYDILVANIPATADFKEKYTFLEPVLLDRQVLVQRRDSVTGKGRVTSQLDLAGDTLWVVDGSSSISRISNLSHEIGDTIYVNTVPDCSSEQLFIMTAIGDIKQAVINESVARSMVKDYPDIDISTEISFSQFHSWIVSGKRPELKDSLNNWILQFKSTPQYRNLTTRYKL
jgi:ABC-type amino acid transport substrate-binding protein